MVRRKTSSTSREASTSDAPSVSESRVHLVAPLTAAALIAQQVGSNAIRDGLFLSWFPVTALPYFVAGSALLAIPTIVAIHLFRRRFPVRRIAGLFRSSAPDAMQLFSRRRLTNSSRCHAVSGSVGASNPYLPPTP